MASDFIQIPSYGSAAWKDPVATVVNLPANGNNLGDARVTKDTQIIYVWDGAAWVATGGGGGAGVDSLNSLTGALTLAQGANITITPSGGNTLTIAASGGGGGIASINADSTAAQLLTVGTSGSDFAIADDGIGGHAFNLPTASASNRGALSTADWSTFNGKQAAGSYITALTGDVAASGPGAAASTLATVNSDVGSFTHASITVNAKGLITAASSGTVTTGTVTSVAMTVPNILSIAGSPVTTSGTLAVTLATQSANTVFAGPTSGGAVAPTFRALVAADLPTNPKTSSVGITLDGSGSVISTGLKGFITVPYSGTISAWTLIADQSGSIVIDVWKVTYSGFPGSVSDSIAGSDLPTLSGVQKNRNQTLSAWTSVAVTAGDILEFNVNSASTVTRCNLVLTIVKS